MKKIIAFICTALLAASIMVTPAMADGTKVVTIGIDLSDEQEAFILNYFGVDLATAQVIYINNQQEREYVGSWIPLEQIGNITISSAYVQPTNSGGIQVKTANLTYVTGNMIASVLSTAGVKNCNIVAAAPFPVSGTGALTGVMIAYQSATGKQLDESKRDLAVQEFTVTQQASESIGENEALQLVNAVKMKVIQSEVAPENKDQIEKIVDNVIRDYMQQSGTPDNNAMSIDNSITNIDNSSTVINNNGLSDADRQLIVELAEAIAKQDYEYEDVRETLERVEENLSNETNITITIDNSNDNTIDNSNNNNIDNSDNNTVDNVIDNSNDINMTQDNNQDNNQENAQDVSVENTIEEDSILSNTNDDLIDAIYQSSTRDEDIVAIEEAVVEEQAAQEDDAMQMQEDPFAGYQMQEDFFVIDTSEDTPVVAEPVQPVEDTDEYSYEPAQPADFYDPSADVYQPAEDTNDYSYEPSYEMNEEVYEPVQPVENTDEYSYEPAQPADFYDPGADVYQPAEDTNDYSYEPSYEMNEEVYGPEQPAEDTDEYSYEPGYDISENTDEYTYDPGYEMNEEIYGPEQPAEDTNDYSYEPGYDTSENTDEYTYDPGYEMNEDVYEPENVTDEYTYEDVYEPAVEEETSYEEAFDPYAGTMLLGGWTIFTETEAQLSENVQTAYENAMSQFVGMNYKPVAFLGSQIVAGTNYKILCIGEPVVPDAEAGLYVVTIYEDLEGNAIITDVSDFDLAEIEETAPEDAQIPQGILMGGWYAPDAVEAAELTDDAQYAYDAAMAGLMGVDYTPVAVLGTKVIAGTEYAILCHAATVTADPVYYNAVVFIAANADGTSNVMSIVPLDLAELQSAIEE